MKFYDRLVSLSIYLATRKTITTLILAMLLTILASLTITRIQIKSDLADLFPEHTPNVLRIKQVKTTLGYSAQLTIIINSPNGKDTMRFASDLAQKLEKDPDMARVDFKRDISFFKKNALLLVPLNDLEDLQDKIESKIHAAIGKKIQLLDDEEDTKATGDGKRKNKKDELPSIDDLKRKYGMEDIKEYKKSPDSTIVSIQCKPKVQPSDVANSRKMLARVNKIIQDLDPASYNKKLEIVLEGDYHKKNEEIAHIKHDLYDSGLVAGTLVLLLLFVAFRKLRAIPLVIVSLGCPILWTIGITWLAIGYLNLITAFIFALLMGLGIDFSIHVLSRYDEARARGLDLEGGLKDSLSSLAGALGTAAFTTAGTFFSLTLFDFRGFSQFGFIAGIGVLLCLAASFFLLPSLIAASEKLYPEKLKTGKSLAKSSWRLSRGLAVAILISGIIISVAAAIGLPRLAFEFDFDKVRSPSKPQPQIKRKYYKEVSRRSFSPVFILTKSLEDTKILDDTLSKWDKHKPGSYFKDWLSIYRFVPKDPQEHMEIIEEMKDLLERKLGALKGKDKKDAEELLKYMSPKPYGINDLPQWVKDQFRDKWGNVGKFVMIFADGNKSDARDVRDIVKEIGTIKVDHKVFHSSASFFILKDILDILQREGPTAVALALLVVILLLFLDLRTIKGVLATSVPLILGVFWMCGAMGLFNIKLNMFNIVVLPTILGIGVDNAVHMYHRYLQDGPHSAGKAISTTGKAAFFASVTTAAGFSGMLVAENRGLISISVLALIGIGTCLYTSVPLLASVLDLVDSRLSKGSKK
ncbi:MAG: MMPL family transporter [Deltaproteobacteria bacterium]|nr:MMPL family transporter [Deltaproteobacteria bacterium]